MVEDARHAIRNAKWLVAQRGGHVLGAAAFAILVPRLMGPAMFGRYALLMSVSMWFALMSGMGAVSMLTRTVPRMVGAGETAGLTSLISSLVAFRALTGLGSAAGYVLLTTWLLGETDVLAAVFVGLGVFCRVTANPAYALFLGLNRAARWGMGELLRRWLTLLFVPVGYLAGGLRGVCLGFFVGEVIVQVWGLYSAREYLSRSAVDISRRHLEPYLRMSTYYAAGGVIGTFTQRSGETIVRLTTGRYEEVAYFGAAYAIYLTAFHALGQLTAGVTPYLVTLRETGRDAAVRLWLARLLKVLVVAAVYAAATMVFTGDTLVPWLLGSRYRTVAANAVPLMFALLPASLASVTRTIAVLSDRPGITATSAALEALLLWGLGAGLAASGGSLGLSWAALAATSLSAVYQLIRTRRELVFPLAPGARAAALALVFVPLAALRGSAALDLGLLAIGSVAYGALLFGTRVLTVAECSDLRRHL
jgi:O-antigen/teichoic acid export membrane protein